MYSENNPWEHASVQDSDLLDIQLASTAPDIPALLEAIQGARDHFNPAQDEIMKLREEVSDTCTEVRELSEDANAVLDRIEELIGQLPKGDDNLHDLAQGLLNLAKQHRDQISEFADELEGGEDE